MHHKINLECISQCCNTVESGGTLSAQVHHHLKKLAGVNDVVLFTGETGTGKSVCAKMLHYLSKRPLDNFVAVNCGALATSLVQSQLFGHEKGAFTGACQRHKGYIESAQNGSLFLDEIGDMPLGLQINLLDFLDTGEFYRVGGDKPIHINTHIIAATNSNLEQAVDNGNFREDLYHRLHIFSIELPPLRSRINEIDTLASHFLHQIDPRDHYELSSAAKRAIHQYHWPGNLRELINKLKRACVYAEGKQITPYDLELADISDNLDQTIPMYHADLRKQRDLSERNTLMAAIAKNKDNRSAAARDLNISRNTFYRLLSKYQLK
ncbi:hypothetical protein VIN01S_12130 [Vibrio inusitatus NBRC 102082]|uniref:Sigma-54 factor interaction domain-containing protein n=1 Tax=Vibrio inusitatus NBRC 102082 TaxID=1219070 RepID=A0A4Y3HTD3_9VIBR|nr:sigma-54 dependent transcriptional regulator [Vibrio inusitatus]GEA50409.1 hypothetical protein VIN01S_12130 [Vibrio inusitatus NBRC 102082]